MAKRSKVPMFKVGLLGESPNDTRAIAGLLGTRYGGQVEFFPLVDKVTGANLETAGAFRQLRREYQYERPHLVIVIRDLDALETDKPQLRQRRAYFRKVNTQVDGKALYLLNIYSIEALIAAHIAVFNDHYECNCVIAGDVMQLIKPVEILKAATQHCKNRYLEAHCAELLLEIDYDTLLVNCRYFRTFDAAFAAQLGWSEVVE